MCVLSIDLVWVEKYGKLGEKPPFLGIFEEWYRYHKCSVNWYWYRILRYRYPILCFGPVFVFLP